MLAEFTAPRFQRLDRSAFTACVIPNRPHAQSAASHRAQVKPFRNRRIVLPNRRQRQPSNSQ